MSCTVFYWQIAFIALGSYANYLEHVPFSSAPFPSFKFFSPRRHSVSFSCFRFSRRICLDEEMNEIKGMEWMNSSSKKKDANRIIQLHSPILSLSVSVERPSSQEVVLFSVHSRQRSIRGIRSLSISLVLKYGAKDYGWGRFRGGLQSSSLHLAS